MSAAYQLALLGSPTPEQISEVEAEISNILTAFGLTLGKEVGWAVRPSDYTPDEKLAAAAAFFGDDTTSGMAVQVPRAVPVVPVVSNLKAVSAELPKELRRFNCLGYSEVGPRRVATALLECAGLLPRQRRVFVSYRRDEARAAAVQLFDALSARLFDVFLDTHGVAPGEDFQSVLWHRLCDSDALVMLDTPTYFTRRWTAAEFGRALAKGISVLSIGWPGAAPSPRTATATRVDLARADVDAGTGTIAASAIETICAQLEVVRSQSIAVRRLNLVSTLEYELARIGGKVIGLGIASGMHLQLPDGRELLAFPAVGVPTSMSLHQAYMLGTGRDVVVVFDHIGIHHDWLQHLDWLGGYIPVPRWVRVTEAAWRFADWEDPT